MNTESVDCRRVENYDAVEKDGDYYFDAEGDPRYIHLRLPGDCFIAIRVSMSGVQNPNDGLGPIWKWDGNVDQPTLEPSIHAIDRWHGYLRAGRLQSC